MAGANGNVEMMVSVLPGTMTGFAALNAGLASINNSFLNMTQAISENFGLVETAVLASGVVIGQVASNAASAFGDFEQSMKIVQMVSGQTTDQIQQLGQAANQFSVQYRMDIDQITEGLQTLGRAGLNSASEQTEVLKNGLNTAKLEGRDLNAVLEELIQNTALLGGDLKSDQFGEQSEYLNNVMVATSLSAPITTHDISETLKYSGGIAAAAGANVETDEGKALLEDYMGTIAAFAQKGVTGSIAGTALRAFFNKPATQDSSVLEGLATIKLKPEYLWEDDQQTMKPISEQIKIIQNQMDNLNIPTMDRLQIWSKIVGGKMGQQMMKLDSSDIKSLTHDIQDAQAAEDLANKSMQTYNANVNELTQRGQAAFRDFGSKVVYLINPILETVNRIMDAFDKLFGGLGSDFVSSALLGGLVIFFTKFASLAKQTLGGFRQGLASIFRDYAKGEKYSINQYRNKIDALRGVASSDDGSKRVTTPSIQNAKSLKDFKKAWSQQSNDLLWTKYQQGKITADQLGVITKTANWKGKDIIGGNVADSKIMKDLAMNNALSKEHINALRSGMTKADFVAAYKNELARLYAQLQLNTKVTKQNEEATKSSANAEAQATKQTETQYSELNQRRQEARQKLMNDVQTTTRQYVQTETDKNKTVVNEAKTSAQTVVSEAQTTTQAVVNDAQTTTQAVVNETKATTQTVIAEWNTMCASMQKSLGTLMTTNFTLVKGDTKQTSSSNLMPGVIPHTLVANAMTPFRETAEARMMGAQMSFELVNGVAKQYSRNLLNALGNAKWVDNALIPEVTKSTKQALNKSLSLDNISGLKNVAPTGPNPLYLLPSSSRPLLPQFYPLTGGGVAPGSAASAAQAAMSAQAQKETEKAVEAEIAGLKEREKQIEQQILQIDESRARAAQNSTKSGYLDRRLALNNWDPVAEGKKRADEFDKTMSKANQQATQKMIDRGVVQPKEHKPYTRRGYVPESTMRSGLITSRKEINDIRQVAHQMYRGTYEAGLEGAKLNRIHAQLGRDIGAMTNMKAFKDGVLIEKTQPGGVGAFPQQIYSMSHADITQGADAKKSRFGGIGSTMRENMSSYLNRDRTGRFLGFANKGLGKFSNQLLNASDLIGGPLMVAFIGLQIAISLVQNAYQEYQKSLREAGERLTDAYSALDTAESNLKKSLEDANPDLDEEGINNLMYDTYANMANTMRESYDKWYKQGLKDTQSLPKYEYDEETDDGSTKKVEEEKTESELYEEAVNENTKALIAATAEINAAMDIYVAKGTDSWWGIDGWTGEISDDPLGFASKIPGGFGSTSFMAQTVMDYFDKGSSWLDTGTWQLTNSQKDENYAGYTEMAGLMLEDFKDANGDWIEGLRTAMGDSTDSFANILSQGGKDYLNEIAKFSSNMGSGNNLRLQQSMKQDKKTWQSLAKEIAKQEKKTGKPLDLKNASSNKKLEGLVAKLQQTTGGGFSRTAILQAAYIQQMQDMLAVAQQAIVPIIQQNSEIAAQNLMYNANTSGNVNGTGNSTYSTANTAAVIAAMVAQIAQAKAAEATYNQALSLNPNASPENKKLYDLAQDSKDANEFYKRASKLSYGYDGILDAMNYGDWGAVGQGIASGIPGLISRQAGGNKLGQDTLAMDEILKNYLATAKMTAYGYSAESAKQFAEEQVKKDREAGRTTQDMMNTYAKNYTQNQGFIDTINAAYLASDMGEDTGSGNGGGSGGGSDNDDDDKKTKKERVDLVLCNKKEIPKLNVNLFKKAPSFTVLNKNFKLRDIKVNTQDKPKAVLSSIKNAIIDVQKRSDPKIIQDESAEYDPVSATDGSSVPSGSTNTSTS